MKKIKILLVLMAVSVIFSGCDMLEFKKPKKVSRATSTLTASGPIVATVNGHSIGLDDLNSEIELYNARVPQDKSELRLTTTEQKTNYLKNEMVQRILFYQEALDRGLNNDPEVQREIEQTKIQMLVYKLMQDLTNSVNVTDQDVRDNLGKACLITEYGAPSFSPIYSDEEAQEFQAEYHRGTWTDVSNNLAGNGIGNAIGGITFEWLDEWWKAYEPERHDKHRLSVGPFLDGYFYEEWFGLCSQGDGKKSPFKRQLKKSYSAYKEMWN